MTGHKLLQYFFRNFTSKVDARQAQLMARSLPKKSPLPDVKDIIVVASGKGGVGKSTTAVNLSVSLASLGKTIGILDADIFGPSIPLMMNISEEPFIDEKNLMIPPVNYGVKCLSMGLLAQQGAIVWRGPLVMSAIQRLLKGTVWGPLDILIIDTPPGTGDVHLSLAQNIPISGVILISTPQIAALQVTVRGSEMYKKLGVPIIGLVENMKHIICNNCNAKVEIFKNSTDEYLKKLNTDILVSIPIDPCITESCDSGIPLIIKNQNSEYAKSLKELANKILKYLEENKT